MNGEIERLRKKVENYPSPSAYTRLAELLRSEAEWDEAQRICERCIHEFPRNGNAYTILASVHLHHHQRDAAQETLEQAVDQDNRCYAAYRMLADLCLEQGDARTAIAHLRSILSFKPQDEAVQHRIEELSAVHGEADTAPNTQRIVGDADAEAGVLDLSDMPQQLTTSIANSEATSATARPSASAAAGPAGLGANTTEATGYRLAMERLCQESGVQGAVIADSRGMVIHQQGLEDQRATMLAALTQNLQSSGDGALQAFGAHDCDSWTLVTAVEQIVSFKRGAELRLVILADVNAKTALLELRARQVLIELEHG